MRKREFKNLRQNPKGVAPCFRCKTPTDKIADFEEHEWDYEEQEWGFSDGETNPMCPHCFEKSGGKT
jgi:hypothetical protein